MTRFRAYSSDEDDEEDQRSPSPMQQATQPPANQADDDEDMSDGGSSMHEDELIRTPPPSRGRNKPVEYASDEDEGVTTELDSGSDSSSSSRSRSPPGTKRVHTEPNIIPWAQTIGVDAQKMHVMQTSLFRMPEEAASASKSRSQPSRITSMLPPSVNRKHSRDSDGEGLRVPPLDRVSFAHDVEPLPYRPTRKYARVESSASVISGNEGSLVDAGLSLGRSFRVGWGPGGTLVHLGKLCAPSSTITTSSNSSVITKTTIPLVSLPFADETERVSRLLSHHLQNSPIESDAEGIPFANPSRTLSFQSFASLFPPSDRSHEASLFRLGHALFDDIDLRLSDSITVDMRRLIYDLRRRMRLSDWLEGAVASTVDTDIRDLSSGNVAETTFILMTGHQIEKACDAAMDAGNVKLASLISQAGGDAEFREDLRHQLNLWREQRVDAHIEVGIRKTYALLAGIVDILEGSKGRDLERCPDVEISRGLDWKRVFGLHLWYGDSFDQLIASTVAEYGRHSKESPVRASPPIPWYLEKSAVPPVTRWKLPPPSSPSYPVDALFSLIRLHSDPACSLSSILNPLSFCSSPVDHRLPWHLYIILSRCMRIRDLSDRASLRSSTDISQDDVPEVEGHSPSADLLASSYALQLEQMGLIQEAAFILLHIEGSAGRKKAIQELLARSASELDEWIIHGLVGSLKIPMSWVQEAQALYALYQNDVFRAYELYLAAGQHRIAHELAVLELAPDAVIRNDLGVLRSLFETINVFEVDGWNLRGKVFLDYAHVLTRVPELRSGMGSNEIPDAAEANELEELTHIVPKMIGILPDVLRDRSDPRHNVAVALMISKLMACCGDVKGSALSLAPLQQPLVSEATRLRHIQSIVHQNFLSSIEVA